MEQLNEASLPLKNGCVLTIGNFDGLHLGHRTLIEKTVEAANAINKPSVVWTFKQHPQSFFGADSLRYINGPYEKAALIEKCKADMYFTAEFAKYMDMSPVQFVKDVLIDAFGAVRVFCGYDFSFGKNACGSPLTLNELLMQYGVPLTVLPPVCAYGEAISSTRIRSLIADGDIQTANKMLGRLYGFCLPVSEGKHIGRSIGSPTINQYIPKDRVAIAYGVYSSFCEIDGRLYQAVSDIGVKPTVCADGLLGCETYIFGYSGDLYGKNVWVYLHSRIREEKRFGTIQELKQQIEADKAIAFSVTLRALTEGEANV